MQIGIIIASLSQALQCLTVAPRLLHAIAEEGTIPFLASAASLVDNEPQMALIYTSLVCIAACMIGSLNMVAPLLSICFLAAYAALNMATALHSLARNPSWRPTWRLYHWSAHQLLEPIGYRALSLTHAHAHRSVGVFGFSLCLTMMVRAMMSSRVATRPQVQVA